VTTRGLGLETFDNFVKRLVSCFNAAGLDYVFTGALAASFFGVPRTTVDVDVLVRAVTVGDRVKLVSALRQAGVAVDEKRVEAALKSKYGIATFRIVGRRLMSTSFFRGRRSWRSGQAASWVCRLFFRRLKT